MGKFDFTFDNEIVRQLERMENFDEIAPKILNEAVQILEINVKSEVSKHKDTGDLYSSVKAGKPNKNKYGWYVSVRPTGKDGKGVRNMEKLAHLEFGYVSRSGKRVAPKPILTKAINDSSQPVNEKMQELFNREVGI